MWHWSVLYCTHQYRDDKSKISKFARFKFKDFSRIFKYFQAPHLFSSTFKGLEVFIPNSSIFKDFSSTLWTPTSVLRHCWLGVRKSVWTVISWVMTDEVLVWFCLERGANCLHMVQLTPLRPKTPSFLAPFKSRLVLHFWYRLTHCLQCFDAVG